MYSHQNILETQKYWSTPQNTFNYSCSEDILKQGNNRDNLKKQSPDFREAKTSSYRRDFSTQKPTRPASLNYKNKERERQSEKREKDGVIGTEIKHILGQY